MVDLPPCDHDMTIAYDADTENYKCLECGRLINVELATETGPLTRKEQLNMIFCLAALRQIVLDSRVIHADGTFSLTIRGDTDNEMPDGILGFGNDNNGNVILASDAIVVTCGTGPRNPDDPLDLAILDLA